MTCQNPSFANKSCMTAVMGFSKILRDGSATFASSRRSTCWRSSRIRTAMRAGALKVAQPSSFRVPSSCWTLMLPAGKHDSAVASVIKSRSCKCCACPGHCFDQVASQGVQAGMKALWNQLSNQAHASTAHTHNAAVARCHFRAAHLCA